MELEWRDKPKNPYKENDDCHNGVWKYLSVLLSEEALLGGGDVQMRPKVKFIRMVYLHPTDVLFK